MAKVWKGFAGAAGVVAILTLLSRLMGLVRKLAQSWALSDGLMATAYDTANTVPNVLFEVAAGGALSGAVIPILARYLARGQSKDADAAASALITWISLVGVPLCVVVVVFASPIMSFLLPTAHAGTVNAAATLLRMFAVQIPLYGLSVVATGILHSNDHFVLPALSPLLSSLAVTATFIAYSSIADPFADPATIGWGELALLGVGTTSGVILFALPQLVLAGRYAHLRPTVKFPPGAAKLTLRLGGAGLAALLAQQIAIVAIMIFANAQGGTGTYTAFNYAYAVFMVPYAVLAVPIATVTFPRISAATGDEQIDLTARSLRLVVTMGMIGGALLFVLAIPAKIVIDMGRDIAGLESALQAMAPGLLGFSVIYHGARVLYARNAAGRVIASNTIAWGTVVLCLIAAAAGGVAGRVPVLQAIGGAMSIGLSLGALAMVMMIRRELGTGASAGLVRLIAVVGIVLALASLLAWHVVNAVVNAGNLSIISAFVASAIGAVILIGAGIGALAIADRQALADASRKQPGESDNMGT
ncbi:murein biosynthesis integral membrane protein MurJ [Trueperella bialowiezensis]|uniref:Integral membrane protein MviN n=1 Tax=Trueperella bialowiezensis TaxID=312285 RepID=A0A448PC02_9ACTO|nr:lipid II flippase MurJ [Trueperella bialowiezensis]VEI12337.1 integral membrane protein MviN [Trueperella bialowiezensis]